MLSGINAPKWPLITSFMFIFLRVFYSLLGAIEAYDAVQFGRFLQVLFILRADFYYFGQFVPSWIAAYLSAYDVTKH